MYASGYLVRPGIAFRPAFERSTQADEIRRTAVWSPAVDIREEAERFVILADVPGVDPASIEVSMDKNVLSLRGQRVAQETAADGRLSRAERGQGAFERRFVLPETANADGITASGKHGVLEVSIPKQALTAPRRIAVATAH